MLLNSNFTSLETGLGVLGGVRWEDTSFTLSIQSGADFGQYTICYDTKVHKVIPMLNYNDSVYHNPPVIATAINDQKNVVISAKTISPVTETRNYNIWCLIALDE